MTLTFTLDFPADVERQLCASTPDLGAAAKEALLVSLYRQRKLSHLRLSESLGLDRFQTEEVLHRHNVTEDLGTPEEYLEDARLLEKMLSGKA